MPFALSVLDLSPIPSNIQHLLDHVQLAEIIRAAWFGQRLEEGVMLEANVLDVAQPIVNEPKVPIEQGCHDPNGAKLRRI
jgi:hypothetical protein